MSIKHQVKLLDRLLKIYERRVLNNSDFKQAVIININEKSFKEFFKEQEDYNDAIEQLLKENLISVRNLRYSNEYDRIDLNLDKIEKVYKKLKRRNLNDIIKEFEEEFFSYNNKTINKIQEVYLTQKKNKRSIRSYLKDSFINTIKAIYYMELNEDEIYERNFSVKIFNDSKTFESLKPMIANYYNNDESIFEKYNIVKKPTYLYFKGKGIIKIKNHKINLSDLKTSVGILYTEDLDLSFSDIKKVITIENETTYHFYRDDESLIIYLAGFSNGHKIKTLNQLNSLGLDLYHYGDIDYGGFNILADLRSRVTKEIKTYNMDLKTLIKYKESHIPINDKSYIENLKTLLSNELLRDSYNVIEYMIKNKVRLEQESID